MPVIGKRSIKVALAIGLPTWSCSAVLVLDLPSGLARTPTDPR
jgi:hypothetical protein